jgi:VanZ family protein
MHMTLSHHIFRMLLGMALVICSYGFLKDVSDVPSSLMPNDKLMHVLVFMVLTLLWQLSFRNRTITGLLAMTAYGGVVELAQHYLTVRTGDWWDWLADICGILLTLLLWSWRPARFKTMAN